MRLLRAIPSKSVVVVGKFETVHLGHQRLLRSLVAARRRGEQAVVVSFFPDPKVFFTKQRAIIKPIFNLRHRIRLLRGLGIDGLCLIRFNQELAQLTAHEFIRRYLPEVRRLIIGSDAVFGRGREAGSAEIQEICRRVGLECEIIEDVLHSGVKISSHNIRDLIISGRVSEIPQVLGRAYSMYGRVIHGQKLGRTLGFPTANVAVGRVALPRFGVYLSSIMLKGRRYFAMTSIGVRPAVSGVAPSVESYLIDYLGGDFYGEYVELHLYEFIRPEESYSSINLLKQAIQNDVDLGREIIKRRSCLVNPQNITKPRPDIVLTDLPEIRSREQAKREIAAGNVLLNCELLQQNSQRLMVGDALMLLSNVKKHEQRDLLPYDIKLDIVFEDEHILVINKQAGLTVHPGAGNRHKTLVNALIAAGKIKSGAIDAMQADSMRPGIVHRLDKDTSGLMIVAKEPRAFYQLSRLIAARKIKRQYLALCHHSPNSRNGIDILSTQSPDSDRFTIKNRIGRHPKNRLRMAILPEGGREAITHVQVLTRYTHGALLLLTLETGRTHQIRLHLESIAAPIIGDRTYHANIHPSPRGLSHQALHAFRLIFGHPSTSELLIFQIPPPTSFLSALASLETGHPIN